MHACFQIRPLDDNGVVDKDETKEKQPVYTGVKKPFIPAVHRPIHYF
ncbi:MAG: hypothetical protein ACAH83_16775 [Alphaproteobacteria bacterium]